MSYATTHSLLARIGAACFTAAGKSRITARSFGYFRHMETEMNPCDPPISSMAVPPSGMGVLRTISCAVSPDKDLIAR